MIIVADASVLVPALADPGGEGSAIRRWLIGLSGGEELHILQSLTLLECISSLRTLTSLGRIAEVDAERAMRTSVQLPAIRHEITRPMAARIWEMRETVTPYAAAYVALVERLESEEMRTACLATADAELAALSGLSIDIELFTA